MADIVETITGFFKGKERPELDQTQAALDDLKKGVDARKALGDFAGRIRTAFENDLKELGITDPARRTEYWGKIQAEIDKYIGAARERRIDAEPTLNNLEAFIGNLGNLAGLKTIIDAKKPAEAAEAFVAGMEQKYPGAKGWLSMIGVWLIGEANKDKLTNGGADTLMGSIYRKLAGWLGHKEPAPATAFGAAPAGTPGAAPAGAPGTPASKPAEAGKAPEAPVYGEKVKTFLAAFKIDEKNSFVATDYQNLNGSIGAAQVETYADAAAKPGSKIRQLYEAVRTKLNGNPLQPRLKDIRFEHTTVSLDPIIAAINGTAAPAPDKFRKFLDAVNINDPKYQNIEALAKQHLA